MNSIKENHVKQTRIKNLLEDILVWFAWLPLRYLVQHIPIRVANLIGCLAGLILYTFSIKKKAIIIRELSFLFDNTSPLARKRIRKIALRSLQIFAKRQVENLSLGKMSPELIGQILSIEGIVNIEQALKNGKGTILLTAHFGSHLLPPLALGFKGYKVNQIAGPPLIEKQRPIYRKVFNIRLKESEKLPIHFIVIGQNTRSLFRVLRNNEILFIAFDGREASKFVPVSFFNREVLFAPGPFKLSLRTKAPILPTFIIRQSDNTHRVIIEPPFEFELANNEEETIAVNTRRFAKKLEEYVFRYPCHYATTLMRMQELVQEGALESSLFPESPEALTLR